MDGSHSLCLLLLPVRIVEFFEFVAPTSFPSKRKVMILMVVAEDFAGWMESRARDMEMAALTMMMMMISVSDW